MYRIARIERVDILVETMVIHSFLSLMKTLRRFIFYHCVRKYRTREFISIFDWHSEWYCASARIYSLLRKMECYRDNCSGEYQSP